MWEEFIFFYFFIFYFEGGFEFLMFQTSVFQNGFLWTLEFRKSMPGGPRNASKIFAVLYEGHLESKERFAIQRYLLIIGKNQNMQVLSHTFTYFST